MRCHKLKTIEIADFVDDDGSMVAEMFLLLRYLIGGTSRKKAKYSSLRSALKYAKTFVFNASDIEDHKIFALLRSNKMLTNFYETGEISAFYPTKASKVLTKVLKRFGK